jgi:LacI family transcriptional regulator
MVTMRQVAAAAGVSVGTVSHYVNSPTKVAAATAARIQQAIDELGYSVDESARALRRRETHSVGLVVPNITNPFFAEIARVAAHALWQHGIQTFLCDAADDPDVERAHVRQLVRRRVDGILMSYCSDPDAVRRLAEELTVPIVFFDRAVPGRDSVESDNRLGGEVAARHVLELGHRRVGILAGNLALPNVGDRVQGFVGELRRQSVDIGEQAVVSGPQALELGERVRELVAQDPRPTAIFATNDVVAIGAWRTLVELGLRVPTDVSLIGFDDIELSRLTVPALTTVAQDKVGIGHEATARLLALMRGVRDTPRHVGLAPRLVVRGSTAPPGRSSAPLDAPRQVPRAAESAHADGCGSIGAAPNGMHLDERKVVIPA